MSISSGFATYRRAADAPHVRRSQGTARFVVSVVLMITSIAAIEASGPCPGSMEVAGECFNVHGRLTLGNGTPSVRIWIIGTKRMLGVVPSEDESLPEGLRRYIDFQTRLYGDFEVCPVTKYRSGEMQDVCIRSASNIVVEEVGPEGVTQVRRLKGEFK